MTDLLSPKDRLDRDLKEGDYVLYIGSSNSSFYLYIGKILKILEKRIRITCCDHSYWHRNKHLSPSIRMKEVKPESLLLFQEIIPSELQEAFAKAESKW